MAEVRKSRRILTTQQASEYLGNFITPKTLTNWRYIPGKGPKFVQLGDRIGYPVEFLDEWVDSCVKTPEDLISA